MNSVGPWRDLRKYDTLYILLTTPLTPLTPLYLTRRLANHPSACCTALHCTRPERNFGRRDGSPWRPIQQSPDCTSSSVGLQCFECGLIYLKDPTRGKERGGGIQVLYNTWSCGHSTGRWWALVAGRSFEISLPPKPAGGALRICSPRGVASHERVSVFGLFGSHHWECGAVFFFCSRRDLREELETTGPPGPSTPAYLLSFTTSANLHTGTYLYHITKQKR
ncbi:hypothetical protein BZA05DRAFT_260550 [Tricharina praecox]|uniref:uncharacterized protein n=1 Tax=Tricharina praecox TaxID=43433 RepID=UPI002220295B|nr:uncharacterized protein BZA05DRAFT_260550 [Tricharina praecox]KAI5854225.1 hypothetical protein BZA05DRAFT_260550 [Tricharina praecox]